MMNNDKKGKSRELKEIKKIIYYPSGWMMSDSLIVICHIASILLFSLPNLIILIFYKVQKSPYSLNSSPRLIYVEDIFYYMSAIPIKMASEIFIYKFLLLLSLVYCLISFFDLIYYYY